MSDKPEHSKDLRDIIASIGDQLCDTVDNNFDIHVSVDTDEIQGQKLSVLVNFLLENVRRNIGDLKALTEQLEQKVKERTERLNLVIEGSNDAVWMWDLDDDSLQFSSHWYALTGEQDTRETLSPQDWFSRVHPKDLDNLKHAIDDAINGQVDFLRTDYRIQTLSGKYRWVMCRGACSYDDAGRARVLAGTQTDISELRSFDQWSGLPNEAFLREFLQDELELEHVFYVVFVAINQLDALTETLDISQVDVLRMQVAQRLSDTLPDDALLARLPGDIYAITCRKAEQASDGVSGLCSQLLAMFNQPFSLDGTNKQHLSVSIGAIESDTLPLSHIDELMNYGWAALREARQSQTLCIYDQSRREKSLRRAMLEQELRIGIAEGHIKPYLQPIIHIQSNTVIGFEALARFEHPTLGFISPAEFIPLAEERGLMLDMGDTILEQSMRMAKTLQDTHFAERLFYIGVNVSAKQFEGQDLANKILNLLDIVQLKPECLRLEVTESTFMKDMSVALTELGRLRAEGVRIALDDFGTGYSSLSYLRNLPIDVLKIDRSFITDLDQKDSKEAIVQTVYSLAKLLELEVVAEGVETYNELSTLRNIGPMKVQGFLYSKPLPFEQVPAYLEAATQQPDPCRIQT